MMLEEEISKTRSKVNLYHISVFFFLPKRTTSSIFYLRYQYTPLLTIFPKHCAPRFQIVHIANFRFQKVV